MKPVFRDYHNEDIPEILSVIKSAFREQRGLVDPPSSAESKTIQVVREELIGSNAIVAEIGDEIIGCVFYHPIGDSLYFDRLSVLKKHRQSGLGTRLIELVEERARDLHVSRISLSVRIELVKQQQFYRALGYEITERKAHEGYERPTYVVMEKHLRSN